MPVEFLTDDEAAAFGRYAVTVTQADLDRVFFLDDADLVLVGRRRGEHMRLGFALQLVTVRWLGTFVEDPVDVPASVLDFVADQLDVVDSSRVNEYTVRAKTRFDHQWEIRQAFGWKEFADVEAQFVEWVAARAWTSGDGPKAIFHDGVSWLRDRKVLLPGVTTLARLVAKVREDTNQRLWNELELLLTPNKHLNVTDRSNAAQPPILPDQSGILGLTRRHEIKADRWIQVKGYAMGASRFLTGLVTLVRSC